MVKLSDLKDLTTKQLRDVVSRAEELIEERRSEEIKEGKEKIAAIAKELGVSIAELVGGKSNKKSSAANSPAPKYRSKSDPSLTWSGRGRMATWLANEIKSGKNKDSFLIKD
jgi:DNA-binding protein H-NS